MEKALTRYIDTPNLWKLETYRSLGGYKTLEKVLREDQPDDIVTVVRDAGLRDRGGASFPTGVKWGFLPKYNRPRYIVCNGDESEPGTFKDRLLIENDPHQVLEGLIISCYAVRASLAFIYLRGEFFLGAQRMQGAIDEAYAAGYLGNNILGSGMQLDVLLHRGAGAYICGEETGLIESLEGKRAYPRIKPPYFPAVLGLYMCPTIVNNVETLCAVKHIVAIGGTEFAKLGTPNNTGTRIVSVSGHVKRPGYYEVEVGKVTIGQLINDPEFGGGLRDGRKLKAVIPGGSSAKVFKAGEKFKIKRR